MHGLVRGGSFLQTEGWVILPLPAKWLPLGQPLSKIILLLILLHRYTVVLCPIVPVAAERMLAFVLQIVTYTLFALNLCILTSLLQLLYTASNALVGERRGEQCLWDYKLIFETNSDDNTLAMETSRKEYNVKK